MAVDFSIVGRALGVPARSLMVGALMDGTRRPASELAAIAGVGAAATSEHFAILVDAGLLKVEARGRQRFYRIASPEVAEALEQLGRICPTVPVTSLRRSRDARRQQQARFCYDHLAGRLGVDLCDAMIRMEWLAGEHLTLTAGGRRGLVDLGVDLAPATATRRPLSRACWDWTERRPHLAGTAGAALAFAFLSHEWIRRDGSRRGVQVQPAGYEALQRIWSVRLET